MEREDLHSDAENYDVWCERCQRIHKHYTFTREDLDHVISEGAKNLSDRIDQLAMDAAYGDLKH